MNKRPPTVMIVDDEEMVRASIASYLELETSYRVLTCDSGEDALSKFESERIDVAVVDFMMPGMDGISLLKHIRERSPLTTRVLLTGYADKENAIRAINEAGLYYYLEKPWDNEHLKLVIRNGVERSALFNELDARVSALEAANAELFEIRRRLIQAFL